MRKITIALVNVIINVRGVLLVRAGGRAIVLVLVCVMILATACSCTCSCSWL